MPCISRGKAKRTVRHSIQGGVSSGHGGARATDLRRAGERRPEAAWRPRVPCTWEPGADGGPFWIFCGLSDTGRLQPGRTLDCRANQRDWLSTLRLAGGCDGRSDAPRSRLRRLATISGRDLDSGPDTRALCRSCYLGSPSGGRRSFPTAVRAVGTCVILRGICRVDAADLCIRLGDPFTGSVVS